MSQNTTFLLWLSGAALIYLTIIGLTYRLFRKARIKKDEWVKKDEWTVKTLPAPKEAYLHQDCVTVSTNGEYVTMGEGDGEFNSIGFPREMLPGVIQALQELKEGL